MGSTHGTDRATAAMLEAHVRFETDRWADGALAATIGEEVGAVFAWLDSVALHDVVAAGDAAAWIARVVVDEPLTDELFGEIQWAVRAAHEALLAETGPLSDLLPRERYDQLVDAAVGLERVRGEVLDQLTASSVYAQLISHVLYRGVKDYVLTENAVVKHVPGASSLLRMGQNAMRNASPNLEAGIDRRLLAFVAANVAETIRDSRAFLDETLDDTVLRTIADEVWATNGPRPVAEFAGLVDDAGIEGALTAGRDVWLAARSTGVVGRVIEAAVEQFYRAHGEEPVAVLLADLGITPERATAALVAAGAPVVRAARDGGHLEAYARRRLAAFYTGYGAAAGTAD